MMPSPKHNPPTALLSEASGKSLGRCSPFLFRKDPIGSELCLFFILGGAKTGSQKG